MFNMCYDRLKAQQAGGGKEERVLLLEAWKTVETAYSAAGTPPHLTYLSVSLSISRSISLSSTRH